MNTQKQIILIVALFFLTVGACAGYAVIELPYRTELQAEWHEAESIERGALLYANNCRTCHGNAGEGFVGPQLNRDDWQDQDPLVLAANRELIERTLVCGRAGTQMPAWLTENGGSLNERQIEHLVNFLTAPDEEDVLDEDGVPTSTGWHEAVEFAHNLNHEITVLVTGDTLQTIAAQHGIGVAEVAEINGVDIEAVDEPLERDDRVQLPGVNFEPETAAYTVTGDRETIRSIVERSFIGAAMIADLNDLEYAINFDELTFSLFVDGEEVPGLVVGSTLALPEGATYAVLAGETIEIVADLHGITPEELIEANPDLEGTDPAEDLAPPDEEGDIPTVILDLPEIENYMVRGQSWDNIAEGYGNVTGSSLAEANGVTTEDELRVGQALALPETAYGTAPPDAINQGAACVQYAVPQNIYDQISTGGPLTPPPPFEGVVEAIDIDFVQTLITLPPDTEVRVVLDNQDEGILHNIQFFESATAGTGPLLTGCISGCAGEGDAVVSELITGIAETEFTFITPAVGEYSFNCEIHPAMVGSLIIEEGAEVPEPAQVQ